jgi:hypothetical protein
MTVAISGIATVIPVLLSRHPTRPYAAANPPLAPWLQTNRTISLFNNFSTTFTA